MFFLLLWTCARVGCCYCSHQYVWDAPSVAKSWPRWRWLRVRFETCFLVFCIRNQKSMMNAIIALRLTLAVALKFSFYFAARFHDFTLSPCCRDHDHDSNFKWLREKKKSWNYAKSSCGAFINCYLYVLSQVHEINCRRRSFASSAFCEMRENETLWTCDKGLTTTFVSLFFLQM